LSVETVRLSVVEIVKFLVDAKEVGSANLTPLGSGGDPCDGINLHNKQDNQMPKWTLLQSKKRDGIGGAEFALGVAIDLLSIFA